MFVNRLRMRRSRRTLRRRIASGDAPEGNALCEIAAALIDELEYRTDFADRIQSRYRPVAPVEHLALRIRTQTALRVRATRITPQQKASWMLYVEIAL